MTHYTHQNTLQGNLSREIFVELLETALRVGEHRFARQAALSWQTQYPGDLYVSLLQAKAYAAGQSRCATPPPRVPSHAFALPGPTPLVRKS